MLLNPNDPNYQQQLAAAQNVAPRDPATNALYENVGSIGGALTQTRTDGSTIPLGFDPRQAMLGMDTPQKIGGSGLIGGGTPGLGFDPRQAMTGGETPQPIGTFNTQMGSPQDDPLINLRRFNQQNTPSPPMQGFGGPSQGFGGSSQAFGQGANGYSGAGTQSGSASGGAGGGGVVFPLQGNYGIVKMESGGLAAAARVQAQGRGNDTQLMHVTPGELRGLQALAQSRGGSLTINPNTGLPEAGFLEDILPVAAAGAAMYFAPPLAGAIGGAFGASGALATGIGAGLLAGGTSLLTQALSGQPVNIGKAATTGALTGLTAGAFAPSTNVLTETPALELAKQTANAPIVQGDFSTAPLTLPSAQPPQLGANPTASEYSAWDKYLGTDQAPAGPAKTGNWFSDLTGKEKLGIGLGGATLLSLLGSQNQQKIQAPSTTTSYIRPYTYSQTRNPNWGQPGQSYYNQSYTAQPIYQAAKGGLMAIGGPVEEMSQNNVGKNIYPMSTIDASAYSTPFQTPVGTSVISSQYEPKTNPFTGEPVGMAAGGSANSGYIPTSQAVQDYNKMLSDRAAEEYLRNPMPSALMPASQRPAIMPTNQPTLMPYYGDASQSPVAQAGLPQYTYDPRTQKYTQLPYQAPAVQQPVAAAPILDTSSGGGKAGGLMPYNLGGYSDGGRLLKGPGDGMSDNIPASIGDKQPARLADGEFVVPADVVSHLGNGSTDAGAKKLYAMMDKVRTARVGNKKQGKQIKAEKYLPK